MKLKICAHKCPLMPKRQSNKGALTSHKYKRTLRAQLMFKWPQIFTRFSNNFGTIDLIPYRWRHQIRKKNTPKIQNHGCLHSITCCWQYSLKTNSWSFCIGPSLDSIVDTMIIGVHSFPLMPVGKEGISIFKMFIFNFLKIG